MKATRTLGECFETLPGLNQKKIISRINSLCLIKTNNAEHFVALTRRKHHHKMRKKDKSDAGRKYVSMNKARSNVTFEYWTSSL